MKLSRTVSITDDSGFQASRAHAKDMVHSERMMKRGRTDVLTDLKGTFTIYQLILRLRYIFVMHLFITSRKAFLFSGAYVVFSKGKISVLRDIRISNRNEVHVTCFFTGTKFVTYVHRFLLYPSNESLSTLPKVLEIS